MTRSEETYRNWIVGSYASMSSYIYYMAKGMIEELGEKQGKELFIKQIYVKGQNMGAANKKALQAKGIEPGLTNFVNSVGSEDSVYGFAWEGGVVESSEDDKVIDWRVCPIAQGFKNLGPDGVEIGEIFCSHIDNATIQAYNSKYECVRESSLNKDELCRLHVKLKE